jgi:predicted nuclease with TOPRIM domain
MTSSNSKNLTPILVTIIAVLLAVSGYLAFDRSQMVKTIDHYRVMVEESQAVAADLELSFGDVSDQLDNMKGENVELNAMIEEQKTKLSVQKNKINGLLKTKGKLEEAKKEIAALKQMGQNYIAEITELKEQNALLAQSNVKLKQETEVLTQRVARTSEENEELIVEKTQLEDYNKELAKQTDYLSEKVSIASVVKVDNLIGTGYKVNKNGELTKRKYAKYVDRVGVCFTTEANLVTDKEEEEFFLRIINPLGETMVIQDLGSGILVNNEGESIRYTTSGVLDYDNESKQMCLNWEPSMRFSKGNYEVEIYNKGFKAGTGSFRLK